MHRSRCLLLAAALVSLCAGAQAAAEKPKVDAHPPCPFPMMKDRKWGLMDVSGKVTLEPKYARMGKPADGMIWYTEKTDGPVGYLDYDGKVVISPRYSIAHEFSEGLAWASNAGRTYNNYTSLRGGMYGVIDKTGKFVVEPRHFMRGTAFHKGLSLVIRATVKGVKSQKGKWVIDSRGRLRTTIRPLAGYTLGAWSEGFMTAFKERMKTTGPNDNRRSKIVRQAGYVNSRYRLVFAKYERTSPFSEGLAAVQKANQKWGYITKTGSDAIKPRFELAGEFSEGLAAVVFSGDPGRERHNKKAKWGFIDKRGALAGPTLDATMVWPYEDGVAIVMLERSGLDQSDRQYGKFAIIDRKGKQLLEIDDAIIEPFDCGLAMVRVMFQGLTRKVGYVDKTGKWVREPTG